MFSGSGSGTEADPYQIATVAQFSEFRDLVNAGNATYNAAYYELTANIDLGTVCHAADAENSIAEASWTPIGNATNPFMGTFDGQGHSITGMYIHYTTGCQGLFGKTSGATVKNFSISGKMTSSASSSGGSVEHIGGAIGLAYDSNIEGITSNVNIALDAGTRQSRVSGVLGGLDCSVISGCTYTGTLDAGATSNCVAGIVAYTTSSQNANNKPKISNCHNAGTIMTTATTGYFAGILAYQNTDSFIGACNCLNTGSISAGAGVTYIGAIYGWYRKKTTDSNNNYYKTPSTIKAVGVDGGGNTIECTAVTDEELASGMVCYLLNGKTSTGTLTWYQNLSTPGDTVPVLKKDGNNNTVYCFGTSKLTYSNTPINNFDAIVYAGDMNGDGDITIEDIAILADHVKNNKQRKYMFKEEPTMEEQDDNYEYVDMGLPSGTLWATRNVGAEKPDSTGLYFRWGETMAKAFDMNAGSWGSYAHAIDGTSDLSPNLTRYNGSSSLGYEGYTDNLTELEYYDDVATQRYSSLWQMPSAEQFSELMNDAYTTWEAVTVNDKTTGFRVTSKIEGYTSRSLFFPVIEYSLGGTNIYLANYWTRDVDTSAYTNANAMQYNTSNGSDNTPQMVKLTRTYTCSVRPVRVAKAKR